MRALREHHWVVGLVAAAASIAWSGPGMAGAAVFSGSGSISGSGTLSIGAGTSQIGRTGVAVQFGNGSAAPAGPSSASSSSAPGSPWAPTYGPNAPNTPLNLSGSSEGSGPEGSSSGGGLVWGDPLSADAATFGKVHTNLRYFGQTGYNGTQQAVGINFTLRY